VIPVAVLLPIAGEVPLASLLGLGLLGALLALDETSYAQTWFSQPLPAGVLAGVVAGDPLSGLAVGLPLQLVVLGNLPVGQTFTGEAVAPVVAGVGGAILSGYHLVPPTALPSSQAPDARLGWILVGVVLFSIAGSWVVRAERRAHFLWMQEGHRGLRDGRLERFDMILLRCLLATALRGFGLALIWLTVLILLWLPLLAYLPLRARVALAWLPLLTVPLGLGILIDRYGLRVCWRYLAAGLLLAVLLILFLR
jgi:mannose/fructose/N-acetylgalactosamine-specific phosphotransferase system component IIC